MTTTTYKGHVITTRIGDHGQETAFVDLDGSQRCFLRGLSEARRYLRERSLPRHKGPKAASWTITFSDSRGSSVYWIREHALRDLRWFRDQAPRQGVPTLTRTEFCAYPGCDGRGEVQGPRARGAFFASSRPCPHHDAPEDVVEGGYEVLDPAHAEDCDSPNDCWCAEGGPL